MQRKFFAARLAAATETVVDGHLAVLAHPLAAAAVPSKGTTIIDLICEVGAGNRCSNS